MNSAVSLRQSSKLQSNPQQETTDKFAVKMMQTKRDAIQETEWHLILTLMFVIIIGKFNS